jgi:hypothetical protein
MQSKTFRVLLQTDNMGGVRTRREMAPNMEISIKLNHLRSACLATLCILIVFMQIYKASVAFNIHTLRVNLTVEAVKARLVTVDHQDDSSPFAVVLNHFR